MNGMTKKEFTSLTNRYNISVDKALENDNIYDTLADMRVSRISRAAGVKRIEDIIVNNFKSVILVSQTKGGFYKVTMDKGGFKLYHNSREIYSSKSLDSIESQLRRIS